MAESHLDTVAFIVSHQCHYIGATASYPLLRDFIKEKLIQMGTLNREQCKCIPADANNIPVHISGLCRSDYRYNTCMNAARQCNS